jgi:hypothetical protein
MEPKSQEFWIKFLIVLAYITQKVRECCTQFYEFWEIGGQFIYEIRVFLAKSGVFYANLLKMGS